MKILLTGGAGFIGSNLADHLLAKGHRVRILDNFSTGNRRNLAHLKGQVEVVEGGIEDRRACDRACKGMEAVCHQAAYGSVPRSIREPELYSLGNLHGFVTVANAAREAGIRRIVYASSSSVYGDSPALPKREGRVGRPLSPYAASKQAKEAFAHAFANSYGMTLIGLRYFNVFGPRQNPAGPYAAVIPAFVSALMKGESPLIYGDGKQARDFTFVGNVVRANTLALTRKGLTGSIVLNIACGDRTSINDLFRKIAVRLHSRLEPEYLPARTGDVKESLADVSMAETFLGYRPQVGLDAGLKKTVEWFVAHRT